MEDKIKNLKHGEKYTEHSDLNGGFEVWKIHRMYFMFSIPTFGGNPVFENLYGEMYVEDVIKEIKSWT